MINRFVVWAGAGNLGLAHGANELLKNKIISEHILKIEMMSLVIGLHGKGKAGLQAKQKLKKWGEGEGKL